MTDLAQALEAMIQVLHLLLQLGVLLMDHVLLHVALQGRDHILMDFWGHNIRLIIN